MQYVLAVSSPEIQDTKSIVKVLESGGKMEDK